MREDIMLGIILGVFDVVLGYLAWRFHRRLSGLSRPAKVKQGKRNSIMLLGLGGVGKTTFVRGVFQNPDANPSVSTEHYGLYRTTTDVEDAHDKTRNEKYTLFVGDYRGQNLGQLVSKFITQQKEPFEPMSYGYINSLVLIVDLFPPHEQFDDALLEPRDCVDSDRVKLHNGQWNDTALDAVFGLLTTGSLKYVCLFVNKIDLLKDSNRSAVQRDVRKRFAELEDRLKKRAKGAKATFKLVLGSAEDGGGTLRVREDLFETSVDGKRGR